MATMIAVDQPSHDPVDDVFARVVETHALRPIDVVASMPGRVDQDLLRDLEDRSILPLQVKQSVSVLGEDLMQAFDRPIMLLDVPFDSVVEQPNLPQILDQVLIDHQQLPDVGLGHIVVRVPRIPGLSEAHDV